MTSGSRSSSAVRRFSHHRWTYGCKVCWMSFRRCGCPVSATFCIKIFVGDLESFFAMQVVQSEAGTADGRIQGEANIWKLQPQIADPRQNSSVCIVCVDLLILRMFCLQGWVALALWCTDWHINKQDASGWQHLATSTSKAAAFSRVLSQVSRKSAEKKGGMMPKKSLVPIWWHF